MAKVAPSILAADFSSLAAEINKVETAGADLLHIDVMDGHFVPNLTIGPPVVAALRRHSKLPFDVHLMITNPGDFIDQFAAAGADLITVHAETTFHLHRLLSTIKNRGLKTGVALNPASSLSLVAEVLAEVDMVLLMTVNPGFGGQKFIPAVLSKIDRLKKMIDRQGLATEIQVDGGINLVTAREAVMAGANILVAGSAIYGAEDVAKTISMLKNLDNLPQEC